LAKPYYIAIALLSSTVSFFFKGSKREWTPCMLSLFCLNSCNYGEEVSRPFSSSRVGFWLENGPKISGSRAAGHHSSEERKIFSFYFPPTSTIAIVKEIFNISS
jgi:hypothetical protein